MAFDPSKQLDDLDWAILDHLQADGRMPISELGRRVALSAPAVGERVRRLEQAGVIQGYRAVIDPRALGAGIEAIVRVRNDHGLPPDLIGERPEVLDCHHVTGEDCFVIRVAAVSMAQLEAVTGQLGRLGPTTTSIVFSSQVRNRPVTREVVEPG